MRKNHANSRLERDLRHQIEYKKRRNRLDRVEDMIKDDEYLEGFVDRKDLDVYYATVGNIGKVDGMSKEQISKKHNEI